MKPIPGLEPPRHRAFARRGRLRRGLLFVPGALALAVGLYAAAGFFGGPWLVDRWLADYGAAGPGRLVSREAVRFNPFTLVAEIVTFEARDGAVGTVFAADSIVVDLAAASLIELRPVARTIVIDRPRIELESLDRLAAAGRALLAARLGGTRVDRLELRGGAFAAAPGTGRGVEIARFDLSLTGFDGQAATDAQFGLDATTTAATAIAASGALGTSLERANGRLQIEALELAAAADRLGGIVGAVEPRGRVDLAADFSATALLAEPRLELTDVSLTGAGLSLTAAPGLTVTTDTAASAGRFVLAAQRGGIELSGRLEVERAGLGVTDTRVTPPQSFTVEGAGVLATIAADGGALSLSLGGHLRGAGDAAVTIRSPPGVAGAAGAAGVAGASRVSIEAAGLPAAMISAYAADAVGRGLTGGDADLRLEYSLDGNRVDGSLRIVTRGLSFAAPTGETAPDGPSLELAAALLENADGVIELALPFAGNAGLRDAAAAALEARIAAVTETPFDTLLPLLGDATAGAVPFLPGDAALTDRAIAAIGQLADALSARPRLAMQVHAGYEPRIDRDALARQQIELHVELATAGPGGRRPAGIDLASPRVRDVLDEFAGERLRPERLALLRDRYACEGELTAVCERAYYESIFDALVANEEITATALNRLGRFRAISVIDALTERGIAGERIELVTGGEVVDTPFGIGLPIELTASDRGRNR